MSNRARTEGTGWLLASLRQNESVAQSNEQAASANAPATAPTTETVSEVSTKVPPKRPELPSAPTYSFTRCTLRQTFVEEFHNERCPNNYVKQAQFSYDGALLMCTAQDRRLRTFDCDVEVSLARVKVADNDFCRATTTSSAQFVMVTSFTTRALLTVTTPTQHSWQQHRAARPYTSGQVWTVQRERHCVASIIWMSSRPHTASAAGIQLQPDSLAATEIACAYSTCVEVLCGNMILLLFFQLHRPGRHTRQIDAVRKGQLSQSGIISSIAQCPRNPDVLLAATYSGTGR